MEHEILAAEVALPEEMHVMPVEEHVEHFDL